MLLGERYRGITVGFRSDRADKADTDDGEDVELHPPAVGTRGDYEGNYINQASRRREGACVYV